VFLEADVIEREPALCAREICKTFGGAQALDAVSLGVRVGEVHGLVGENGSGKSTFIKILAGYHAPDSGELEVWGRSVKLPLHAGEFRRLGIDFVHQDLGLIPSLSVVENLRIAHLAAAKDRLHISWRAERRRARATFARYGIDLDPGAAVGDLRPVERALLAIVRAVEGVREATAKAGETGGGGLLVLDEPTVFLPRTEVDELFGLVREVALSGASVLFVSHDLAEVLEICDRVTVLRDGRVVDTVEARASNHASLVEMIVGGNLAAIQPHARDVRQHEVVAQVVDCAGGIAGGVSLELRRGEILGLTGLVGSGFEELPYLLYGAWPALRGRLVLRGRTHNLRKMTPVRALELGMALVPADRQRDAAIPSLSITDNMTSQSLGRFVKRMVLRRRTMVKATGELMARFDVRPSDPRPLYESLSGGNQQKALLAKWLEQEPPLLLLHEPTQGVDVGAREQIFRLIRAAAANGTSVICASSDYEQLAAICDRVFVMSRGALSCELTGADVTKDGITKRCYDSIDTSKATNSSDEAVPTP
jgi:ribose transport system ATP-binding protein